MAPRRSILALVVGLLVLSSLTHRARKAAAEANTVLDGPNRYVDAGVVLRVVRQDLVNGRELLPTAPPLVVLREHRRGGIVDTAADPVSWCGPSRKPAVWYCSEQAEPLILHGEQMPPRLLVYGAMGAGKTTTLAQWLWFRTLELIGTDSEIGCTAPTNPRVVMIARAIRELWPSSWWTWKERDMTFTTPLGVTLRLVSTHQASRAEGSRVQGYTWAAHAGDEIQDQLEVDGDIEARGRGAPGGLYKRFNSATAKPDPAWRAWRDRALSTSVWGEHRMDGLSSPFIHPRHWSALRETMTDVEYKRKVLALDVGSEAQVYYAWDREQNLRPLPAIGAVDVTARETARFGGGRMLIGYDPGRVYEVSVFLRAFEIRERNTATVVWYVVDEVTSERSSVQTHVRAVRDRLRSQWGLGADEAFVKGDPFTKNHRDVDQPSLDVYRIWQQHGFRIQPAMYRVGSTDPAPIPINARLDMVNTLLCSATGVRRLFVACDHQRRAAAHKLVECFERLERDGNWEAEKAGKGSRDDLSHWGAALGYGLYAIERPRLDQARTA